MKQRSPSPIAVALAAYFSITTILVILQLVGQSFNHFSFIKVYASKELFFYRYLLYECSIISTLVLGVSLIIALIQWRFGSSQWRSSLTYFLLIFLVGFSALSWSICLTQSTFLNKLSISMMQADLIRIFYHGLEQKGYGLLFYVFGAVFVSILPCLFYRFLFLRFFLRLSLPRNTICVLLIFVYSLFAYLYTPRIFDRDELQILASESTDVAFFYQRMQRRLLRHLGPFSAFLNSFNDSEVLSALRTFDDDAFTASVEFLPLSKGDEWLSLTADGANIQKYNVVLMIVESLRHDVVDLEIDGVEVMPNLKKLSGESAVFTNHYSPSSYSSYADLVPISSQSPVREDEQHFYGISWDYPRPRLYDLLKPLGYHTAIISSQDEGWGGMINYLQSDQLDTFIHAASIGKGLYVSASDSGFWRYAKAKKSGKVDDAVTADELIRWIDSTSGGPFFVYTNFQNSHFPYRVPSNVKRTFIHEFEYEDVGFNRMTAEMLPEMLARYFDSLHYIDVQIGRLVESLKESGKYEETIIVVIGDTGQAFLEHGYSNHGGPLYDEVLRTPLIIHLPDALEVMEGRYDFYSSHINIAPTVLSMLGLPSYPGFQGESLVSNGVFHADESPFFFAVQSPLVEQFAVLYDQKKFIYDPNSGMKELYDLSVDRAERQNIYDLDDSDAAFLEFLLKTHLREQLNYYTTPDLYNNSFPPRYDYQGMSRSFLEQN